MQENSVQTPDGFTLVTQSWIVDNAKASLIIAHGFAEHSARYRHVAEALNANEFNVYALNFRGHGKSTGEEANITAFLDYLQDLDSFMHTLSDIPKPRFLLGHSMGGIVASQYVQANPNVFDGLLLSSAFLKNATKVSPVLLALSGVVSSLLPSLGVNKLDSNLISRDKTVVEAYKNDPLVYNGKTKARLGAELLKAGPKVLENASKINLPILIMLGTADQIASPEGSQNLFDTVSSQDKILKRYEGLYHELLNEPEKETVIKDILEWLYQVRKGTS